jgi:hypothetical protein
LGDGLEFLHQPSYDSFLDGPFPYKVPHNHLLVLGGEPLQPANPLLKDHGVPRQVVVHEDVGDLEVYPLSTRISRDEGMHTRRSLPEPLDGQLILLALAALNVADRDSPPSKSLANESLCFLSESKDDDTPICPASPQLLA